METQKMADLLCRISDEQSKCLFRVFNSLAVLARQIDPAKPFSREAVAQSAQAEPKLHADLLEWLPRVADEDLKNGLDLMRSIHQDMTA